MRIHGNNITDAALVTANRHAGTTMTYSHHGSRSRTGAVEVSLRGNSRRAPMGGDTSNGMAATWDQWGVFLAALFLLDSTMTVPRVYTDETDFHRKTASRFIKGWPTDAHGDHKFRYSGTPNQQNCTKCSAVVRWS